MYVTIMALILSVPLGIIAAVFLSDIVSFRIRGVVKPVIELLAAIPSVAYGFFAVLVLAPWMQRNFGFPTGTNALNASLILSVMALPTIVSVAEDSLSAAGRELREASYSLGATRAETIVRVVIPAAHSGIVAGIVLGMMRAIGETMVVWMASGNASQIPSPWWDLSQSVRTMTATIAGDMGETVKGSDHYRALFMVGTLLLVLTFFLNSLSGYFLSAAKKNSCRK
jgi:phosphate ABC transporter permease protein PstC